MHIRNNYPIFFRDRFPFFTSVGWRVLPPLHHAPHIDFVLKHEMYISPCPEVAAFKLAIPFRIVLTETCIWQSRCLADMKEKQRIIQPNRVKTLSARLLVLIIPLGSYNPNTYSIIGEKTIYRQTSNIIFIVPHPF